MAANAIHHLINDSGDLGQLVYDLDEVISHYIWHAALIGLTVVIGVRATRSAGGRATSGSLALTAAGALAFGFTFFAMVVEGETVPIGAPAAVLLGVGGLLAFRTAIARRPALAIFVAGYLVAAFLFALWAAMNGWELVPPCEVIGC